MSTNTNSRSAAENLLGALLWPILPEELTWPERDALEEAVAAQERYAAGGESRKSGPVVSEAVGDVRVTYGKGSASMGEGIAVQGERISPEAAAILTRAGLLTRWI